MKIHKSEVVRLREQITAECEAMKLALNGFASGTATHKFIVAHLRRVDWCCNELEQYVGEQETTRILCELYDEIMQ